MIIRLDYSNFIMGIFYTIFGALFYIFLKDSTRYDGCRATDFLNWSKYTYIVCFVVVAVLVLKYILAYFTIRKSFLQFYIVVDFLTTIAVLVCAVYLLLKDSKVCGDLHTLAMVFYIVIFAFVALVLLFTLYHCIFTKRETGNDSGYISISFASTSYAH